MNTAKKTSGFALAAAAAVLLATAPMTMTHAGSEKGHCVGANSCKGTSDCATATTSCKGQNSCKGQGFLSMTESECDTAGGTFEG